MRCSIHSITPLRTSRCPSRSCARHLRCYRQARYRPSSSLWAGRSFAGENALVSRTSAVRHLLKADRLPHVDRYPLPAAPALLRCRRAQGRRRRARRVVFIGQGHVVRPSSRRSRRIVIGVVARMSSLLDGRRSSPSTRGCTDTCPSLP